MEDAGRELMLAATDLLRPGPTRVGSLGRLALPRTVRVRTLGAWIVGAVVGLVAGAVLHVVIAGIGPLAAGCFGGAAIAHVAVNVEPLAGEHLLSWLHLTSVARHQRVEANGCRTRVVLLPADADPGPGAAEVARAADLVAWAVPATRALQQGALVAIGICPLDAVVVGPVQILGGTVDVSPGWSGSR